MRRKLLILAVAALLALVLAVPASASKPIEVDGNFVMRGLVDEVVTVGNRCFVQTWWYADLTGDIKGTCAIHERQVAHGPCEGSFPGSYRETLHLEAECTEMVFEEKSGDFRLRGNGEIVPVDPPEFFVMHWRENCVILSGTGDLANLHGSLTLESHPDEEGAYSGELHFEPDK